MAKETFYVTSPIFYPNANLHMGHAYVMTISDVLARYHRLVGEKTYFLTGADENTGKVVKAATEKGKNVDEFLLEITDGFKNLFKTLEISYNQFIRTTDKEKHWPGAFAMWNKLVESDDIYKSTYEGLYCPSCEAFYTEKDLVDGKCPYHGIVPELIKEDNYFFKLSKYTTPIKEKIQSGELEIVPVTRKNEILSLLDRGLEDVSFSRPIKNVPHGIPVPGDPEQVIYVWCDALVNYISALGYGTPNDQLFKEFWPANVHVIGKDILRFHAAIWPAMLLSAGLPLPKKIMVHGLIMSGGAKMSKSLGNVIDPYELINEYGPEALRYYFARHIPTFDDGDLTKEGFKNAYNASLANGIGNLVSRIMKMATTYGVELSQSDKEIRYFTHSIESLEKLNINEFTNEIWAKIAWLDEYIQKNEPFKKIKVDQDGAKKDVYILLNHLLGVALMLEPIMPETSQTIQNLIGENKMPEKPLFLRKE
jgi:methionyl-tRNA synthetase